MSTGIKPVKELVAEANKVITTLSIDEARALQDTGEASSWTSATYGSCGAMARFRAHSICRAECSSFGPILRAPITRRFRFWQDINSVLRIGLALGARH